MNGQISAALAVMGAMVLFAGSAADRAGAQTSSRIELNGASARDNVHGRAPSSIKFCLLNYSMTQIFSPG